MRVARLVMLGFGLGGIVAVACGGDDDPPPPEPVPDAGPRGVEPAGQACTVASECYEQFDGGAEEAGLKGDITCLDRVPNGYCTHTCENDEDCCAVPGECLTNVKQVCSPFTNDSTTKYCFLSCEDDDIRRAIAEHADAGYYDGGVGDGGAVEDEFCRSYASVHATCRSSGGGNQNRKVCIPQE
jgi:hypothetical protein